MLIIILNNMKYNFAKPEVTNSDACLTDSLQHKDVKFPFTFSEKQHNIQEAHTEVWVTLLLQEMKETINILKGQCLIYQVFSAI